MMIQQIHCRAMSPIQDSPSIKLTYSASVVSPLPVVMSALLTSVDDNGNGTKTYQFKQGTTIPSYLIAIGAGNLVGREIGPRSTVWCEPEVIDQAAWEFDVSNTNRPFVILKQTHPFWLFLTIKGYRKIHCYR